MATNRGQPYWIASVTTLIVTVTLVTSLILTICTNEFGSPLYHLPSQFHTSLTIKALSFFFFFFCSIMGCGMSTKLDPEDATLSRRHMIALPITDINSPTSKNLDHGGDDSVQSSIQRSRKSVSSQGKDVDGEKEEEGYHSQIVFVPGSPSFKHYCIASSHSRDQSSSDHFNDTDSAYSTQNGGDEDSANNKPEENKERKKKERRGLGFRNVIHRGMPRGKRNLLNFGCYTSHASYDDTALNKVVGKTA